MPDTVSNSVTKYEAQPESLNTSKSSKFNSCEVELALITQDPLVVKTLDLEYRVKLPQV
jgi:hypothetical protein